MHPPSILLALAVMTAFGSPQALRAGIVTTTADSGPGSLRAAIAAAVNGETISFAPALDGSTILLTTGELVITGLQLSIDASALPKCIKISGNNSSRVLMISGEAKVSLHSLDIVEGRSLDANGGGIAVVQSELNCVNTTIRNCFSSYDGGGLWLNDVTGTLDRCSFLGNDSGTFGGAVFLIGNVSPTFKNSVISGNRAPAGGGFLLLSASPQIINCTIQGNSSTGIRLEFAAAPILRNTIVWGNRSGNGSIVSQQILNGGTSTGSANVDYCLVEGAAGTLNNLNGSLDPKFINPPTPVNSTTPPTADSDLRVFTDSPVINSGDNVANPTLLDRAGRPRIQNTTIDLGAFEGGYVTFATLHPSLSKTDDANGNSLSNFLEYASGMDPTAPDDPAVRPQISSIGGFFFLTSSQRYNAADTAGIWQTSTDLGPGSWRALVIGVDYTIESISFPAPSRQQVVMKLLDGDGRRFYRQGFPSEN